MTRRAPPRRWSAHVTESSNALDLEPGIFKRSDPKQIACSLKRSAERSRRRKTDPFHSAMSMLSFYLNRAGRSLSRTQRRVLTRAKGELRSAFGRNKLAGAKPSGRRRGVSPKRSARKRPHPKHRSRARPPVTWVNGHAPRR
jgi:hypothetical protein